MGVGGSEWECVGVDGSEWEWVEALFSITFQFYK